MLDAEAFYSGPSPIVAVMNGTRYGGGFQVRPHSSPCDGLLDVVGGPMNRFQLVKLMLRVLRGTHTDQPQVHTVQGREVVVRWNAPTPILIWTAIGILRLLRFLRSYMDSD